MGLPDKSPGSDTVGVTILNPAQPAASAPASDPASTGGLPFGRLPAPATAPAAADPNELKPNAPADPNELKPTDSGSDQALPPPPQINEIQQGQGQGLSSSSSAAASSDASAPASDKDLSSSKKKKKKGLRKLIPF
jgi:hypothetical protein